MVRQTPSKTLECEEKATTSSTSPVCPTDTQVQCCSKPPSLPVSERAEQSRPQGKHCVTHRRSETSPTRAARRHPLPSAPIPPFPPLKHPLKHTHTHTHTHTQPPTVSLASEHHNVSSDEHSMDAAPDLSNTVKHPSAAVREERPTPPKTPPPNPHSHTPTL